jgi:hypothetical protein
MCGSNKKILNIVKQGKIKGNDVGIFYIRRRSKVAKIGSCTDRE